MPAGNQYGVLDSRDLIADFYPRLEAEMERIWAPRVSIELQSDREVEELAWLGHVPAMVPWVGGRNEEFLNKYTLSIRNVEYEATLPISVPDQRRDKTGQIRQRVADLAARTATHWNDLVGEWVAAGTAGTKGLAYDGQFFYDTDHAESGTSQSNDLTSTEVPAANVGTASTLTTTEAADVISQTIAYMMTLTDDKGEPINQAPRRVTILATKQGHYVGLRQAIRLQNLGTGSGNNNPLLAWDYDIDVQFVPQRVTAADALYFFLGDPAMGATPLIRTSETGVTTGMKDETFENNRIVFGVNASRGVGYGMWQKAAYVALS